MLATKQGAPCQLVLFLAALALCGAQEEETCDPASGQCPGDATASRTWTPLSDFEERVLDVLNCDASQPASIVSYCQSTRPSDEECDFAAAAPDGTGDSFDYQEWRRDCLHRCLFSYPDLNVADLSDDGTAMLSPLTLDGYKTTSFLDQRSLQHGSETCQYVVSTVQMQELANWGVERGRAIGGHAVGEGVHFIFHLGHTGSTLLSRALGEIDDTLVLREPPMLSWMATTFVGQKSKELDKLWRSPALPMLSRRHTKEQTVVVKARSLALRFMRPALRLTESAKAVFMYSTLRTHLTVVLAREGERFPDEQYEALDVKAKVFNKVYAVNSPAFMDLNVPKRMVLSWMKRMLFVHSLPSRKIFRLNMEDFLESPRKNLLDVAEFFGLTLSKREANAIVDDESVFGVYAKDTSLKWGVVMQTRLMKGRADMFSSAIEEGMAFARKLIGEHKALSRLEGMLG